MTAVVHDLDTQLRLAVAVEQLTQPGLATIDRSERLIAHAREQADREHLELIAALRRRHADAARRRDKAGMRRAIDAMTRAGDRHRAERARVHAGVTATQATTPSLLDQLLDAVHGTGGSNGAAGAGAYRSAIGLVAADLIGQIDRTVRGRHLGTLYARVRAWAETTEHADAAELAEHWVEDARATVEPSRYTEARAACPVCHTRHVEVVENGERVRKAAIQINLSRGIALCIQPGCTGRWDRAHFNLLAGVLRQDLDEQRARGPAEREWPATFEVCGECSRAVTIPVCRAPDRAGYRAHVDQLLDRHAWTYPEEHPSLFEEDDRG